MTQAERRDRAAAPLAAEHGTVSTLLRLALGLAGLAVITIPYFLASVVLLAAPSWAQEVPFQCLT